MCNFIAYKKISKDQYVINQKDRDNLIIGIINGHFSVKTRDTVEQSKKTFN